MGFVSIAQKSANALWPIARLFNHAVVQDREPEELIGAGSADHNFLANKQSVRLIRLTWPEVAENTHPFETEDHGLTAIRR